MFIYMLPPIDNGFDLLLTCEGLMHSVDQDRIDAQIYGLHHLHKLLEIALEKARKLGWEGDFTVKPKVMVLPPLGDELSLSIAFIWKQPNNGSVFIASADAIPYFSEYLAE